MLCHSCRYYMYFDVRVAAPYNAAKLSQKDTKNQLGSHSLIYCRKSWSENYHLTSDVLLYYLAKIEYHADIIISYEMRVPGQLFLLLLLTSSDVAACHR